MFLPSTLHSGMACLIQKVQSLSRTLSIPSFAELGITEREFFDIAQRSSQNNSNPSNPREIGVEDYIEILRKASHQS
ncbi:MAG: hypothetical protein AYK18_14755 [Theionarchaea archaeon DG-70]|nr:MAG: hypothetical protein AYK18_14755 [Theionarchaea archaeon DG-70]